MSTYQLDSPRGRVAQRPCQPAWLGAFLLEPTRPSWPPARPEGEGVHPPPALTSKIREERQPRVGASCAQAHIPAPEPQAVRLGRLSGPQASGSVCVKWGNDAEPRGRLGERIK